jgi:hypothetical protein
VRAPWHVGDVAWGLRQHEGREDEWRIRLWVEGGAPVAWSWLKQDGRDRLEQRPPPRPPASSRRDPGGAGGPGRLRVRGRRRAARGPRRPRLHEAARRHALPRARPRHAAGAAPAPGRFPVPRRRPCRHPGAGFGSPRGVGPVARHGIQLRPGARRMAVPRIARLRGRGAGRPVRGVLPVLARRRERRRRVRAGRRPAGVPPPRPGRRRLHLRARALARAGGRQAIVYCASLPACALYESVGFRRHATQVGFARPDASRR